MKINYNSVFGSIPKQRNFGVHRVAANIETQHSAEGAIQEAAYHSQPEPIGNNRAHMRAEFRLSVEFNDSFNLTLNKTAFKQEDSDTPIETKRKLAENIPEHAASLIDKIAASKIRGLQ
jgi:hypothetical protein